MYGYVPDPIGSKSGVTVGTGVDLGQLTLAHLEQLPADLAAALKPYLGLKGKAAQQALKTKPLTLSGADVDALDVMAEGSEIAPLRAAYQRATGKPFESLPDAVQTVLASVTFQYGEPWVRCPQFWATAVHGSWLGMVSVLENFGDRYPTRRQQEATYLKNALGVIPKSVQEPLVASEDAPDAPHPV